MEAKKIIKEFDHELLNSINRLSSNLYDTENDYQNILKVRNFELSCRTVDSLFKQSPEEIFEICKIIFEQRDCPSIQKIQEIHFIYNNRTFKEHNSSRYVDATAAATNIFQTISNFGNKRINTQAIEEKKKILKNLKKIQSSFNEGMLVNCDIKDFGEQYNVLKDSMCFNYSDEEYLTIFTAILLEKLELIKKSELELKNQIIFDKQKEFSETGIIEKNIVEEPVIEDIISRDPISESVMPKIEQSESVKISLSDEEKDNLVAMYTAIEDISNSLRVSLSNSDNMMVNQITNFVVTNSMSYADARLSFKNNDDCLLLLTINVIRHYYNEINEYTKESYNVDEANDYLEIVKDFYNTIVNLYDQEIKKYTHEVESEEVSFNYNFIFMNDGDDFVDSIKNLNQHELDYVSKAINSVITGHVNDKPFLSNNKATNFLIKEIREVDLDLIYRFTKSNYIIIYKIVSHKDLSKITRVIVDDKEMEIINQGGDALAKTLEQSKELYNNAVIKSNGVLIS